MPQPRVASSYGLKGPPGGVGPPGPAGVLVPETVDYVPTSVYPWTGVGSRADALNFEGGIFRLYRPVTVAKLALYVVTRAGAPTIRICVFQAPFGVSGVAALVGKIETLAVSPSGTILVGAFAGGAVTLPAGDFYILQARDSAAGSYTLRAYIGPSAEPLATDVPPSTRPTRFTTALVGTVTPATFNPVAVAGGGQAIPTVSDVGIVYRMINP